MSISINIDKAKDIWKDKWREARKPLLNALDIEFVRALESNDIIKQTEISAEKQALRDVTTIELPDTPEAIKDTWPDILGENPFK